MRIQLLVVSRFRVIKPILEPDLITIAAVAFNSAHFILPIVFRSPELEFKEVLSDSSGLLMRFVFS